MDYLLDLYGRNPYSDVFYDIYTIIFSLQGLKAGINMCLEIKEVMSDEWSW